MTKILVTGGAGFIGANFIYYQLSNHPDDQLLCFDKLTYASRMATLKRALHNENVHFVKGDIADPHAVFALFENYKPDLVVNFAAESHVDRSLENPGVFLQTNVIGAQVLMDACCKYGVTRFHQVSTDEVYGDLPLDRPELRFAEDSPLCPSSPYSASKAAADLLVQAYHRTFQLPVSISRSANNYGPYQFTEKLIPLMIVNALAGEPLPVYGKGVNVRDWLHVEDHCAALDLIIRKGRAGEIYNLGGDQERSNLTVVKMILKIMGKPESLISFVADRPGHDLRYAVNSAKIREELGWQPTRRFEDGLQETIHWYLEQPEWWQGTGGER